MSVIRLLTLEFMPFFFGYVDSRDVDPSRDDRGRDDVSTSFFMGGDVSIFF